MQYVLTYFAVVEVEADSQAVAKSHNHDDSQDDVEDQLVRQVLEGRRLQQQIKYDSIKL